MIIVALSLLGASSVTGIGVALVYLTARGKAPLLPVLARWAAGLWIFNFLLDLAILCCAMPARTGPYGGGQWLLWPLLLTGVLALFGGSFIHVRSALDAFNEQVNGGGSVFSLGPRVRRGRRPPIVEERPEASAPANSSTAGILALVLVLVVAAGLRSEEHTSELQSHLNLVCRLLLEKKKHATTTTLTRPSASRSAVASSPS